MTVVIDASVGLKWVLSEPGSEAAFALRGEPLIAPSLWLTEMANALWRKVRIGDLTIEQAEARLAELINSPVAMVATELHLPSALRLAGQLRHPVYDCIYLAVALSLDTHVVTDDRRFAAAADGGEFTGRVRLLER